ncbi:hypothetical protein [Thauera sp. 2A1]|uniref:phage tail terminator protein n=1 Tax=Thauera sp. 2A1 TaxID=2570191 RepID=UPI001290A90B|nr:hypothetical protein [Thauera sp. 2A1]KAI5914622.1 hypothetical protein GH664_11795 [Thauera sp. 2A1]
MGEWNFHAAEAGIVEQLKARCQSGPDAWARAVETRDVLATVAEEMQVVPAVYVVYDGYAVLDADEQRALLAHRWLAVVAVSDASQGREATARNQKAGPYVADVFAALHGYLPPGSTGALVPAQPPRPYFSEARFAYYAVAFTSEVFHSTRSGPGIIRPTLDTPAAFPHP